MANFRIKHFVLTPDHISLNCINKLSLCTGQGLKSTDQMFLEAEVPRYSVITTKSRSLMTPAVWLCCTLKHSQWVLRDGGGRSKHAMEGFRNAHISSGVPGVAVFTLNSRTFCISYQMASGYPGKMFPHSTLLKNFREKSHRYIPASYLQRKKNLSYYLSIPNLFNCSDLPAR